MSLSMDDKILGEKVDNYCSSSEDEDEGKPKFVPEPEVSQHKGFSTNTGPKGVINDWRRYKQLETEKREEQEKEKLELMKKLSITCKPESEEIQEEDLDELEDDFMQEYRRRRMQEMKQMFENIPRFGSVLDVTKEQFVDEIDRAHPSVTVVVHIHDKGVRACAAMDGCVRCLAQEYPTVKFCRMAAMDAKLSKKFVESAVPALLVYKRGDMIGNFIRLGEEFGDDFFMGDVESFLLEHGMLPDKSILNSNQTSQQQQQLTSSTIREPLNQVSDSDSELD